MFNLFPSFIIKEENSVKTDKLVQIEIFPNPENFPVFAVLIYTLVVWGLNSHALTVVPPVKTQQQRNRATKKQSNCLKRATVKTATKEPKAK